MKHEPTPDKATVQAEVATPRKLHRDIETRSKANLKKVGLHVYAADPSTEIICSLMPSTTVRCSAGFPAIPFPQVWFEAAANPNWTAIAHNDPFESAIEQAHPASAPRLSAHSDRAPSLHAGGEPRARIAGQARSAGRRDGVHAIARTRPARR